VAPDSFHDDETKWDKRWAFMGEMWATHEFQWLGRAKTEELFRINSNHLLREDRTTSVKILVL
jgi:hypothetical protein